MISLSIILLAWLLLVAIFGLFSLITVVQMVRFSIMGRLAYLSTAIFIIVSALALLGTALFFTTVDWSQAIDMGSLISFPTL